MKAILSAAIAAALATALLASVALDYLDERNPCTRDDATVCASSVSTLVGGEG